MKIKAFYCIIFFILLFSFTLRIFHFSTRFGIGSDDARDYMIAQESLVRHHLPLFGSFSSAGPFVFGPLFYWMIIGSKLLFPHYFASPYVMTFLFSISTVVIYIFIGKLVGGPRMAIFLGFLAASSPQLVLRSTVLGQHSYIALFSALSVLFFVLLFQTKRSIFSFFIGISVGISISMHYQGLNLLLFVPFLFLIPSSLKQKIYSFFLFLFGFILTQIPLLYWDIQQQFSNTRNILDYLLIGQFRIYTPNSWRLFISNYLPTYWSFVSGGYPIFGVISEFLVCIGFFYLILKKLITKLNFILYVIFFLLLVINRYYKGERFEGYMIYLTPFILFCTAYILTNFKIPIGSFSKIKIISKILTVFVITVLIMGNTIFLTKAVPMQNNHLEQYNKVAKTLVDHYPNQKIALFDYSWLNTDISYPISLILSHNNAANPNGVPVGIHCKNCLSDLPVITEINEHPVVVLDQTLTQGNGSLWQNVNQENIYNDLISRWEQKKLPSTFSFTRFIKWKLGME